LWNNRSQDVRTLKQSGRQLINAPREMVWQALNDTSVLKRCIDGCESFEQVAPGAFKAKVRAHIGPVNAVFAADVTLEEEPSSSSHDAQRFRLQVALERAAAGFGKGEAEVTLSDEPGQATLLSYETNAVVGGKLAQLGARLVESAAGAMASAFFRELEASLTGKAAQELASARTWLPWTGAAVALLAIIALLAFL